MHSIFNEMVDLSIIIVNYNSKYYLRRCLNSILDYPQITREIFVSDNKSTDGSIEIIKKEYPHVFLIENNDNIGYSSAANRAIKESSGRYILIINNDIEVLNNSLQMMIETMDSHPNIGLLGCRLLNTDGTLQQSFGYFNLGFLSEAIQKLFFNRYKKGNRLVGSYLGKIHKKFREVDWISGACIMTRRKALEDVGMMDENYFMYFEEIDLCNRVRKKGWNICYTPDAKMIHHGGKSSDINFDMIMVEYRRSQLYFYKKHYGTLYMNILKMYLILKISYHYIKEEITGFIKKRNTNNIPRTLLSVVWRYK
jgi:GT2 family glycosyltransferase